METKKMNLTVPSLPNLKYASDSEEAADRILKRGNMQVIEDNLSVYRKKMIKHYLFLNTINERQPIKVFLNNLEKKMILEALSMTRGNQKDAALILDLKESTLCEKIKKYKINNTQTHLLYMINK